MKNLQNVLFSNKLYVFLVLFCTHNVLFGMEKNLDKIAQYDQKIKEKKKQLENIKNLKIFKKNSDQKSVALLKSRVNKEIELYNLKKGELVSKL